ncbi:hypothetical protein IPM62_03550 [Candidatus Woesebacteria bacterium]|nr:MAG: hypothetical protein IPM62_03550 [Candidatus Woesebacteria bacterium]
MCEAKLRYSQRLTNEEKLAIQTCPGFISAQNRSLADYYEPKRCADCNLTSTFTPSINQIKIEGKCPKK